MASNTPIQAVNTACPQANITCGSLLTDDGMTVVVVDCSTCDALDAPFGGQTSREDVNRRIELTRRHYAAHLTRLQRWHDERIADLAAICEYPRRG